ncbi:hypothetical protein ACC734_37915, partial [Rhizobium ruizarguesonis]
SGWPRVVETAIHDLAPLLIGEDPAHTERLWQRMHIAMMGHGILGTVGGGAMTGIDMSLWDIKGKALGVPVRLDHVDQFLLDELTLAEDGCRAF